MLHFIFWGESLWRTASNEWFSLSTTKANDAALCGAVCVYMCACPCPCLCPCPRKFLDLQSQTWGVPMCACPCQCPCPWKRTAPCSHSVREIASHGQIQVNCLLPTRDDAISRTEWLHGAIHFHFHGHWHGHAHVETPHVYNWRSKISRTRTQTRTHVDTAWCPRDRLPFFRRLQRHLVKNETGAPWLICTAKEVSETSTEHTETECETARLHTVRYWLTTIITR